MVEASFRCFSGPYLILLSLHFKLNENMKENQHGTRCTLNK